MTPGSIIVWALAILAAVIILVIAGAIVLGTVRWVVDDHRKRHPKSPESEWGYLDALRKQTSTR